MCRTGGRRCPSCRGNKNRQYQRARYAAKKQEQQYSKTTNALQSPNTTNMSGSSITKDNTIETQTETQKQILSLLSQKNIETIDAITMQSLTDINKQTRDKIRDIARKEIETQKQQVEQDYTDVLSSIREIHEKHIHNYENNSEQAVEKRRAEFEKRLLAGDMYSFAYNYNSPEFQKYEQDLRSLGENVHLAAMITTLDKLEENGINQDSLQNNAILDEIAAKNHPGLANQSKEFNDKKENYTQECIKNGKTDVRASLEAGQTVTPEEMFEYISNVYNDYAPRKNSKTLIPNRDEIKSEISKIQQDMYKEETMLTWYLDPEKYEAYVSDITSDEKFSHPSWKAKKYEENDIPMFTNSEAQKRLLEALDKKRSGDETDFEKELRKETGLLDLNTLASELYVESIKQETGSTYGSTIPVFAKNSNVDKATIEQFNKMTTMFPSEFVDTAKSHHLDLKLVRDNDIRKRQFFKSQSWEDYKTKKKETYATPLKNSFSKTDRGYDYEGKLFRDGRINEREYLSRLENYPLSTDTKNAERLKLMVEQQNKGETSSTLSKVEYDVTPTGKRTNKVSQVELIEFTDELGNNRIAVQGKKERTISATGNLSRLSTDGTDRVTVHEIAHYIEQDPRINIACNTFRKRRTRGLEETVYLPASKKNVEELVIADNFITDYVGKEYNQINTEVFSMGMESIFANDMPHITDKNRLVETTLFTTDSKTPGAKIDMKIVEPRKRDNEHRNLIIGLLSSVK